MSDVLGKLAIAGQKVRESTGPVGMTAIEVREAVLDLPRYRDAHAHLCPHS